MKNTGTFVLPTASTSLARNLGKDSQLAAAAPKTTAAPTCVSRSVRSNVSCPPPHHRDTARIDVGSATEEREASNNVAQLDLQQLELRVIASILPTLGKRAGHQRATVGALICRKSRTAAEQVEEDEIPTRGMPSGYYPRRCAAIQPVVRMPRMLARMETPDAVRRPPAYAAHSVAGSPHRRRLMQSGFANRCRRPVEPQEIPRLPFNCPHELTRDECGTRRLDGKIGQESGDVSFAQHARVHFLVIPDVPANPRDVGDLGESAVVLGSDGMAHLIEELGGRAGAGSTIVPFLISSFSLKPPGAPRVSSSSFAC